MVELLGSSAPIATHQKTTAEERCGEILKMVCLFVCTMRFQGKSYNTLSFKNVLTIFSHLNHCLRMIYAKYNINKLLNYFIFYFLNKMFNV